MPTPFNPQSAKLFLSFGRAITSRCPIPRSLFRPSPNSFRPPAPAGAPFSNHLKSPLSPLFKISRSNSATANPSRSSAQTAPANPLSSASSPRFFFPPPATPASQDMTPSLLPVPSAARSVTTPVPTRAFMPASPHAKTSSSSAASITSPLPPRAIASRNSPRNSNSPNLSIARSAPFLPARFNASPSLAPSFTPRAFFFSTSQPAASTLSPPRPSAIS